MAERKTSESRRKANAKYDAKTYKKVMFHLRYDEDADLIKAIEDAKSNGISYREWLKELYNK